VLVDRGSLDGEQEVPEVLAHALEGGRVGLSEQALLGGGLEGEDLVGVPLAVRGQGDQDLAAVRRVDVTADPALLSSRATRMVIALDRLQEEHRVIHGVLDTVDRALVNYISQSGDTSALTDAADLLTDTLLSHLAYEERELIDPLARYGFYGYDQD
jgi:hypothetical protein